MRNRDVKNKLNGQRRNIIVESVRAGLSRAESAQRALIGRSTLLLWLQTGHNDRVSGMHPMPFDPIRNDWAPKRGPKARTYSRELELLDAVEHAEAERTTEAANAISAAGKGGQPVSTEETTTTAPDGTVTVTRKTKLAAPDWKAYAFLLNRHRPDLGVEPIPDTTWHKVANLMALPLTEQAAAHLATLHAHAAHTGSPADALRAVQALAEQMRLLAIKIETPTAGADKVTVQPVVDKPPEGWTPPSPDLEAK